MLKTGGRHQNWRLIVCAPVAVVLTSCSAPGAGAPPAAATTVLVVTPAAPTSVPAPTAPLPPTALITTPPPTVGAGVTVSVPTAGPTAAVQPTAAATPGAGSAVGFSAELPPAAAAIPAIEVRNPIQDPGVTRPSEIQFELAEPIGAPQALRDLLGGLQAVAGVVALKSDGVHVLVQYDDSHVQPMQLRQRLTELGHAPAPGTDVPAPGRAAD